MQPAFKTTLTRRISFLSCLLLLLLSFAAPGAGAQDATIPEADLKAAFLYNFTKFVEWPADAFGREDSPFVVGIYGDDEFVSTLRTLLRDKKAHGHPFEVRKLSSPQEAKNCQILFFRESDNRKFSQIYENIKKSPILTVGEGSEFLDAGGMFALFFEDKQLRFEVNPAPAENAKLSVSSKLLRLAKKIRKGGAK
ncbi:MAG TPA: YfiR family protein [Verrucomicrobiae bacterium]|jgi:hypothetical protein|nr:YfiR family protein [Verrucomicrobiae bacterium]